MKAIEVTRREITLWRELGDHENICRFIASSEVCQPQNHQGPQEKFCYVLCERCDGSLVDYLTTYNKQLNETQIVDCALQILNGIEHMHKHEVCHRDIKIENVLFRKVDDRTVFKLCDFGSSTRDHSISYSKSSKADIG